MKPLCLIVMDGWGVNEKKEGNAAYAARTPNIDRLFKEYPHTTLDPTGEGVGLPRGQMGNSEVGHLTLGAGRVIFQDLSRINKSIENGSFYELKILREAVRNVKESGAALHLMGLVSDGGVHSHIDHLEAIVEVARREGLSRVFVHAFLDGRDTPPKSGAGYVKELLSVLDDKGVGRVATVSGRYYAMDRDNRWERVEKAYKALVDGEGRSAPGAPSAVEAVKDAYARGETDEFVLPTVVDGGASIADGDSVIFFNFRADRARELTRAIADPGFEGFTRKRAPSLKSFVTMTRYDKTFPYPVLFAPMALKRILPEVISRAGIKQFRVSETEKYAHVTFFFNGGVEAPFPGEDRLLIPSVKDVPTYDKSPAMRAVEIGEAAAEKIEEGEYGFVLLNFANGDMVGHTGVFEAAVKACEAVDSAAGKVVEAAKGKGWSVIVTSDHGNVEEVFTDDPGETSTQHSTLPVPFILVSDDLRDADLSSGGGLKDVAPTVLKIMGLPVPEEMEGEPLF